MGMIENRIATRISRLNKEVVNLYEAAKVKSTDKFWQKVDSLEEQLMGRLGKRPITSFEIDAAAMDFRRHFQGLCMQRR